ncbi:NosD domain-containing protein, partial [Myxococcota bacterium]
SGIQTCGDGDIEGTELCDERDGNTDEWTPDPRCNATCKGFAPYCGDGITNGPEGCDDGLVNGTYDRCKEDCSGIGPHCGDGVVDTDHEACEPALGDPCDGCILDCSGLAGEAVCGDGVVCAGTEACDDGFLDACGTCNATCTAAGLGSTCGDGEVCPELEFCDGGPDPCNDCAADCKAAGSGPICGDGKVCAETEACDDADTIDNGEGGCLADCSAIQICGNGTVEGTEVCDDGNTDDCVGHCLRDCSGTITITGCGDGVTCPPEECDDGRNGDDCDGCLDDCTAYDPPPGPTVAPAVIDEDTLWYGVQSPFVIQTGLAIIQGTTLTVCHGTSIQSLPDSDVAVVVRGHLDIVGTEVQPVRFTSAAAAPAPGDWTGIRVQNELGGTISIHGAVIEYASMGLDVQSRQGGPFGDVTSSSFLNNRTGSNGGYNFRDCVFSDNDAALFEAENASLYGCVVTGNVDGVQTGSDHSTAPDAVIEGCLIADNSGVGIKPGRYGSSYSANIEGNTIVRNGTGVVINDLESDVPTITGNTLCDNTDYDLMLETSYDVFVNHNWWCTTDPDAIATRIWDVYDDSSLGLVTFEPFLTEPPPDAPEP